MSPQLSPGDATVVARHVFYNHSALDRSARADARDDRAIATDKSALLPGAAITPANFTGYSRGANGVMIDVQGLPAGAVLTVADFDFRAGNNSSPQSWRPAPRPRQIAVRASPDGANAARVTLVWKDKAIRNSWLQVTMLANADTGLAAPDVFYVGNLVGHSAQSDGAAGVAQVGPDDVALPASRLRQTAAPNDPADYDRNGRITRADVTAARKNLGAQLFTGAPLSPGVGAGFASPPLPGAWRLAFDDEFSSSTLDPVWHTAQYWDHDLTVVGNGELEAYDPTGVAAADGLLRLTARRDDAHGVPYTSGLAMTGGEAAVPSSPRFSFLYGYLEVRAKLPSGTGLWPAVWMMPASFHDDNGEIDVVELLGADASTAHFTVHKGHPQEGHEWHGPDLSRGFHTYAVDWQPDHVAWFVDGVERARTTDPSLVCREAMYLIMDLAVGGAAGAPDASTAFPATMDVDYVRVWQ
jgi:hypothetical protein